MFLHPSPPSIAVPAAGGLCLQPTTISLRSLPYPPRSARAPQKCRDDRCPADSLKEFYTGDRLGRDHRPDRALTAKPSSDSMSTRTRRRTATATGGAPPAVDFIVGPGGAPRPSTKRANTPARGPRPWPAPPTPATPARAASPVPTVRIPSDRDRAEPAVAPLVRLTPLPGDTPTVPTKLDALGAAAELQFADSVMRHSHAD